MIRRTPRLGDEGDGSGPGGCLGFAVLALGVALFCAWQLWLLAGRAPHDDFGQLAAKAGRYGERLIVGVVEKAPEAAPLYTPSSGREAVAYELVLYQGLCNAGGRAPGDRPVYMARDERPFLLATSDRRYRVAGPRLELELPRDRGLKARQLSGAPAWAPPTSFDNRYGPVDPSCLDLYELEIVPGAVVSVIGLIEGDTIRPQDGEIAVYLATREELIAGERRAFELSDYVYGNETNRWRLLGVIAMIAALLALAWARMAARRV